MDAVKLLQKICSEQLTIAQVAGKLGISRQGLYLKLNGSREFRASEIAALRTLLSMDPQEVVEIFFEGDVYVSKPDYEKYNYKLG